jgi:hypothetical protein
MKWLLIATRPRVGSHMLRSALGTKMYSIGVEPFQTRDLTVKQDPLMWNKVAEIVPWLMDQVPGGVTTAIVVLHNVQTTPKILRELSKLVTHTIVLYRQDTYLQYLSLLAAKKSNVWYNQQEEIEVEPDAEDYRYFEAEQRASVRFDRIYWPGSVLVTYEGLCTDWTCQMERIGRYIGMELAGTVPVTVQNKKPKEKA